MNTQTGSPQRHESSTNYHSAATAVPFLNPTSARFASEHAHSASANLPPNSSAPARADHTTKTSHPAVTYRWTSRNNRKGRHAVSIDTSRILPGTDHQIPPSTTSWWKIAAGVWRMFTAFPVWDISYCVATAFTLGSVVWVINAFFIWLPLVRPDTQFETEELYGGGITAFIGVTIFEVGSFLLVAEAVNINRTACFGWALEQTLSRDSEKASTDTLHLRPTAPCTHHHINRRHLVGRTDAGDAVALPGSRLAPNNKSWLWFPSKAELRTHYIRELGFLASFVQLLAASIFWIAGLTALPGIYNNMSRVATIVLYWTPQVVGGTGFIISGSLFMLETQSRWYKPAFKTLGWWVGAWNTVGGIGFTLCPAFGYDKSSWAQYQSSLSTFWASWAFLVGSVLQWYESLEKYPVHVKKSARKRRMTEDEGDKDRAE